MAALISSRVWFLFIALTVVVVVGSPTTDLLESVDCFLRDCVRYFTNAQTETSWESQGQIAGARESLNGRENIARRKVKKGEKSPCGQCLTRPVLNGHRRSGFWSVPESFCVFLPNQKPDWRRPFWNWSGKTLSPGALLAVLYFSSCHIFPPV